MTLWNGRFKKDLSDYTLLFTSSLDLDKRLYFYDILGSIAHVESLFDAKVIKNKEKIDIIKGLKKIEKELDKGIFKFKKNDEDIHMAIERRLIELIGDTGKKMHTGRSRNDQVSLDMRMFLKDTVAEIVSKIENLNNVIKKIAKINIDVYMPGYTHLQQAQPILFSHYLLAYKEKFERDIDRFNDVYKRCDVMPLGAGALAGTPYPINRKRVAQKLGFSSITNNSMDTTSDRDFVLDFLYAESVFAMHCSRLSEDFIIYSTEEFGFLVFDDAYTTGSSIMPQKKNPDILELIRGKSLRVIGSLNSFISVLKGLPLTYNRDMQEDKHYLFSSMTVIYDFLEILPLLIKTMKVKKEVMRQKLDNGYLYATAIADYLVSKKVPFREAHSITGRIVSFAISKNKKFKDLTYDEFLKFSKVFKKDVLNLFNPEKIVNAQKIEGSTSLKSVKKQLGN